MCTNACYHDTGSFSQPTADATLTVQVNGRSEEVPDTVVTNKTDASLNLAKLSKLHIITNNVIQMYQLHLKL